MSLEAAVRLSDIACYCSHEIAHCLPPTDAISMVEALDLLQRWEKGRISIRTLNKVHILMCFPPIASLISRAAFRNESVTCGIWAEASLCCM